MGSLAFPRPAYRGVFLLMGDGGVFLQVRFFWKDFPCVVKILEASFRFVLLACFFTHVAPFSNFELTWAQAFREGLPPF